ncbi:MAG: hypothetical protein GEV06_01270 [Luteitalea sp.]|nr:hypothetical protein [Luteitalea sp.]
MGALAAAPAGSGPLHRETPPRRLRRHDAPPGRLRRPRGRTPPRRQRIACVSAWKSLDSCLECATLGGDIW